MRRLEECQLCFRAYPLYCITENLTNIVAVAALALAASSAHAIKVDDFTVIQSLADSTVTPPEQVTGPLVVALGASSDFASRTFQMIYRTNSNGQAFGLDSNVGVLSVSKGPNSTGAWKVDWETLAGLSLDFTANDDNGIL